MVLPVREFSAAGYRSLQRIPYPMSRLDVFVGANGVGKSNLYRGLELLRAAAARKRMALPAVSEGTAREARNLGAAFAASVLPEELTPRELEVLRLIAGGFSNREIAHALGTAEGTVRNQASSVLSKLGVRDRTRGVLKALELGWLARK